MRSLNASPHIFNGFLTQDTSSSRCSRTIRVVLLSSSSTTSLRERRKSLNDRNPSDFSQNDGSIRFICALTAELCSQSASSFSVADPQRALQQRGRRGLRVGHRARARRVGRPSSRASRGLLRRLGATRDAGQRVVGDELVAGGGERPAGGAGDADADDVAAEPLAALRQRDVVGVAGDDHDVGEVGQPEHVLDGVDRQPDVGAVLAVRGRGEQLHEVDRAGDELAR